MGIIYDACGCTWVTVTMRFYPCDRHKAERDEKVRASR